jgi:hypothetical protein
MILNSTYSKDLMNSEMFAKIVFRSKQNTLNNQAYPTFKAARQINDNCFAVERSATTTQLFQLCRKPYLR